MECIPVANPRLNPERVDYVANAEVHTWYKNTNMFSGLQLVEKITHNSEPFGIKNSFWRVRAIFNPKFGLLKEQIIRNMKEKGIDLHPSFYLLSSQPADNSLTTVRWVELINTVSYRISAYGVDLPCGMNITYEGVK